MIGIALATARCHAAQPPAMPPPRTLVESAGVLSKRTSARFQAEAGETARPYAVSTGGDDDQTDVL